MNLPCPQENSDAVCKLDVDKFFKDPIKIKNNAHIDLKDRKTTNA